MNIVKNEKGQAIAPRTICFGKQAFDYVEHTEIRWLAGAGIFINSRGTTVMIDPVLEGFDMPLLIDPPISCETIPSLDALLVTHIDNDHFSRITCRKLKEVCSLYHAPHYVAEQMQEEGIQGIGHEILETFPVKEVEITLTPALHNWQNGVKKYQYREWKEEEYCGYWIDTVDGSIWLPGDSKLLDAHLQMHEPDVILLDFADNEWHIGLQGAITLANTYPHAQLICIHWGSVDAPDMSPFNGNPEDLINGVIHPERIHVLAPGEPYILTKDERA